MGIHLRLEQRQRQMLAQECPVCRQLIDERSQQDGHNQAKLGLLRGWGFCPNCQQEVEAPFPDDYKWRFVRWCLKHGVKPK